MARDSRKVVAIRAGKPRNLSELPQPSRPQRGSEPQWHHVKLALLIRLEARRGKENELAEFLRAGLAMAQQEPATAAWFAIRLGKSTFAIFDAFTDETGRQGHLTGPLATALKEKSRELLAKPPVVDKIDVLAAKLAGLEFVQG